jgi:hypothetical protein
MKEFLDFDKDLRIFYDNYYFEECRMVLKIPMTKRKDRDINIKIDEFNLSKYTYLMHFD